MITPPLLAIQPQQVAPTSGSAGLAAEVSAADSLGDAARAIFGGAVAPAEMLDFLRILRESLATLQGPDNRHRAPSRKFDLETPVRIPSAMRDSRPGLSPQFREDFTSPEEILAGDPSLPVHLDVAPHPAPEISILGVGAVLIGVASPETIDTPRLQEPAEGPYRLPANLWKEGSPFIAPAIEGVPGDSSHLPRTGQGAQRLPSEVGVGIGNAQQRETSGIKQGGPAKTSPVAIENRRDSARPRRVALPSVQPDSESTAVEIPPSGNRLGQIELKDLATRIVETLREFTENGAVESPGRPEPGRVETIPIVRLHRLIAQLQRIVAQSETKPIEGERVAPVQPNPSAAERESGPAPVATPLSADSEPSEMHRLIGQLQRLVTEVATSRDVNRGGAEAEEKGPSGAAKLAEQVDHSSSPNPRSAIPQPAMTKISPGAAHPSGEATRREVQVSTFSGHVIEQANATAGKVRQSLTPAPVENPGGTMTEEVAGRSGERGAPNRANSALGAGRAAEGILASIRPEAGGESIKPGAKVNEPVARGAAMSLSGVEAARADSNSSPPMAMAPIEFQTGSRVEGESIALRGSYPAGQVTEIADFLASRVEGAVKVGQSEVQASIRMQPPELGLVRVELKVTSDGTVTTRFIAERAETGELLSQNIKQFTQALERHGLNVGKVQVSVEPKAASETLTRNNPETHGRNEGQPRDQQSRSAQDRPEARRDGREQFRRWEELLG